jgi:hypothetical protein
MRWTRIKKPKGHWGRWFAWRPTNLERGAPHPTRFDRGQPEETMVLWLESYLYRDPGNEFTHWEIQLNDGEVWQYDATDHIDIY